MPAEPSIASSRRTVLLVAALFFVPLAAAFALYYGGVELRPVGRTNRGDLIQPPRPLPAVALLDAADQQLDAQLLRGKWTLSYVGDGACDARCIEALTLI